MIDLVVIGRQSGPFKFADEEMRFAAQLLSRSLPRMSLRLSCPALDLPTLAAAANTYATRVLLANDARVLLLAHDQAVPAPHTFSLLETALDRGANTACAFDSNHPPQEGADTTDTRPDYFTLRGMERYAERIENFPSKSFDSHDTSPLALLTTVKALRNDSWLSDAHWVFGAYLHDFSAYRQGRREEIISLVPRTTRRILDVGGGEGGFLAALKSVCSCETHLAEISESACKVAATRVDKVWNGDFHTLPIDGRFDCISFLDVIEHMTEPAAMLVRACELLTDDGFVIASIPNVGHWSVVADLIEGRWDYVPAGIHCITHLRFFTRRGIEEMMQDAGLVIEHCITSNAPPPPWFDVTAMQNILAVDMESLTSLAFFVVARKAQ